jgi:UPF0176 protein
MRALDVAPACEPALQHTSFYRFVQLDDAPDFASRLRQQARSLGLLGSVLVASEGLNGMLAGAASALDALERTLHADARLQGMAFKRSYCETAPFHRLKVHHKARIVPLDLPGAEAPEGGARRIAPADWDACIADPAVLVLDNRNSFEYRLGRFRGAVDPGVTHFRDFARYVTDHAEHWKAQGLQVAMYCTGGIRCDKTAGWMQGLGLDVVQLDGGILHYLAQRKGQPSAWEGECFVFDNRVALGADLRETGTTAQQVFENEPDGAWRLARARRLAAQD